jgi:PKD repeat protein
LQNGDKVKVVATNAAGCSGSSSEITTTITPGPVATAFKITTSPSGITFNFNDTSSNNATYTHSWNFGDGKTGSGNVVNHTYTQNGTYTVWMVIKNGNCIDSISAQVTAKNTGIEEASIQSQVAVWPNPFTQVINVSWSNESKPVSLELNDVQGARIVTLAKADIYNLSSTTLATENLPSGIYWVKVVMENGQVVKRIIKL